MIETVCAFTGHRPKSFPWKYNETAPSCTLLKKILTAQIKALVDRGVTDFLSGMAQGTDLWCSQIVLNLKKKNSALKLHCVLPCKGDRRASGQHQRRNAITQFWSRLMRSFMWGRSTAGTVC